MRTATILTLCWTLAAGTVAAAAQVAGAKPDPAIARGEHIARLVCASCHVVASDQEFPPLLDRPTPSFSEIGNRPGSDARVIQKFITTTHWDEKTLPMKMPDLMLTAQQSLDVARYIVSLRKN